jgi:hypothetical protein
MPVISGGVAQPGALISTIAGTPAAGTSEVQTITIGGTPDGGTFRLTFDGHRTAAISWTATDNDLIAAVDAALEALANVGSGGVTVAAGTLSSGTGTILVTFDGTTTALKRRNVPAMTVESSLTGSSPTIAITTSTAGVDCGGRGLPSGGLLLDTTNGRLLVNDGSENDPVFAELGVRVARVSLGGAALQAGVQAWQNPHSDAVLVHQVLLDVTTQSTGACTVDIGSTATSATTASDNLIDGASVASAALINNEDSAGTNGKTAQKVAAGKWVTFKSASGDATGLVAVAYLYYTIL